jgi:ElaA protein
MNRRYLISAFDELTVPLLYDILALRSEVFVVEQDAVYMDLDGLDAAALHICLFEDDMFIGYARILPPGCKFEEASVGRIVIAASHRGKGLGKELIQRSMMELANAYGPSPVRIEAQQHLQPFYESLGFTRVSDPYDWGGIPHVKMLCGTEAA